MSGDRDDGQKRRRAAQRARARSVSGGGPVRPEGKRRGDDDGYEVGYGKPPRSTRFRKGQSGNPRGRPKKRKPKPIRLSDAPADIFLEQEAYRTLKFRENGEELELPVSQAVIRAMFANALKGNRLSQRYAIEYVERKEERRFQNRIERFIRLEKLKLQGEEQIAEHRQRGQPPPDLLPHPDDIVLKHRTAEAWIDGPETREDLRHYEHLTEFRHLCIMQSALNRKRQKRSRTKAGAGTYCPAMVFAGLINQMLPQRFRQSEADELILFLEYEREDRRRLEARIEREVARLERERPSSTLTDEQRDIVERATNRLCDQLWPDTEGY